MPPNAPVWIPWYEPTEEGRCRCRECGAVAGPETHQPDEDEPPAKYAPAFCPACYHVGRVPEGVLGFPLPVRGFPGQTLPPWAALELGRTHLGHKFVCRHCGVGRYYPSEAPAACGACGETSP